MNNRRLHHDILEEMLESKEDEKSVSDIDMHFSRKFSFGAVA
jgi:hypothetical protein